ncbi:MAG: DUF4258 domain-containing protein [Maribacter sp.]
MFIKRLGFFMVGLSIGIVFLTFFLKKKSDETGVSFCYFPNCRVLKDFRSKPIVYSDRISEMLENKELDTIAINHFFTDGEIDFGNSNTKSKPCKTYSIEAEIDSKEMIMEVKNCPNKVTVLDLK